MHHIVGRKTYAAGHQSPGRHDVMHQLYWNLVLHNTLLDFRHFVCFRPVLAKRWSFLFAKKTGLPYTVFPINLIGCTPVRGSGTLTVVIQIKSCRDDLRVDISWN